MQIGFVGLGVMGGAIAARLVASGHSLTVFDLNANALGALDGRVKAARSPGDCAAQEVVFVLVSTGEQVVDVVAGSEGLLAKVDPGRPPLIVVMSTILPATVRRLDRLAREKNARVIDAPVSGGPDGAATGNLMLMVGAEVGHFAVVARVFDGMKDRLVHCGGVGSGATSKIVNNLIGVANWLLMVEAMALAGSLGMDRDQLAATMENGSGRNLATSRWPSRQKVYETHAARPDLMQANNTICKKDIALVLSLAKQAGIELPIASGLSKVLENAPVASIRQVWQHL